LPVHELAVILELGRSVKPIELPTKHKQQMYVDLQQFSFSENLPKAGRAELRRK
jgi:hypothetical protein